jgi:hypothetical protein
MAAARDGLLRVKPKINRRGQEGSREYLNEIKRIFTSTSGQPEDVGMT